MHKLLRSARRRLGLISALALVVAVAALASFSGFNGVTAHPEPDGPSVRVAALKNDDGSVRVGLQALGSDGQWGERMLPTNRVISATAPTDTWLRSTPVRIDRAGEVAPLFCVIAHGASDDRFWLTFRAFLFQSASLTDTDLRFETYLDGADQAAAIERCSADGAAVIASTLASPDDVREPLKNARAAGARIVTFNAGIEHAESVRSGVHIALNDVAAGELAGRQFNERGITGQVGCIVHERDNLSLEHRCDGLADAYKGAGVTRIQLEELPANQQSADALVESVANQLAGDEGPLFDAVLTLNGDTLILALNAVDHLGDAAGGLRLSSVGAELDDLAAFSDAMLERHLDAVISDSADSQGHFVAGALQLSYRLHHGAHIGRPQLWLAQPSLVDQQSARAETGALSAISASLERMIAASMNPQPEDAGVEVRVAALKRIDGSVTFAIESKDADGRWSIRQTPQRNALRADAATGAWMTSSALELPTAAERAPLFCVVTHGSKQDRYWQVHRGYMHVSAHLTDTNWRYEAHLDGADQAAAIDQCSADGAAVIASTLADPEAVTPSLLAAKAAGARIVTFNSGASFAEAAGSEIHVALDDRKAGVTAALRIAELGYSGPIACLIHEEKNVGLEERCQAVEDTYTGESVTRLRLTEGAPDAQIAEELYDHLTDPDQPEFVAVVPLNADTTFNAWAAFTRILDEGGRTIVSVPIGTHADATTYTPELRNRHLPASFNDSVESEGFLVVSAMYFVHTHHTAPEFIDSPQLWLATPFSLDPTQLRAEPEVARRVVAILRRYVAEAAADDE